MPRKPNYAFERNARVKAKAEKRQAKLAAKNNWTADREGPKDATSEVPTQPEGCDC